MEAKTRVLIVDDNADLCRTLSLILVRKGHEVITAESGADAIEILQADNSLDLILIDVMMPGKNGIATLREVKELAPQTRVVIMTGYAVAGLVTQAVKLGVDGVLYKPFDVEIVLNMVLSEDVLDLFAGYLNSVWERIAPVLGNRSAQGVLSGTVSRYIREEAPLLHGVEVTQTGFSLEGLRPVDSDPETTIALRAQLQGLLAEVFDMLGLLSGNILTDPLIGHLSDRLKGESSP